MARHEVTAEILVRHPFGIDVLGEPGVAAVDVSMAEKAAVVTFDDTKIDVAGLTEATAGVGFPSRLAEEGGD